jgi:hypothetical protein
VSANFAIHTAERIKAERRERVTVEQTKEMAAV